MANVAFNGGLLPGSIWDPIKGRSLKPNRVDSVRIHTAWVNSPDIYGPGKGPGGTYAHFYNPTKGSIRQHQEIHRKAYAALDGNGRGIDVEHQDERRDMPLSDSQIENDARLFAHCVLHFGTPNRIATWDNTDGLAWHRLGCKGYFGRFDKGDMTTWSGSQTGERWSTAFGKTCPTNPRIRQIPEIYRRAQAYINGKVPTAGATPAPEPKEWDEMASKEEIQDALWDVLTRDITIPGGTKPLYALIRDGSYALTAAEESPGKVWTQELAIGGATRAALDRDTLSSASLLRYAAAAAIEGRSQYARMLRELGALQANLAGDVTASEVARELAPLLLDDLAATITDAIAARQDGTPEEIAQAVITEITARLED